MRFWGLTSTAFLLSLAACNKGETANVQVTTGQETGALTCQSSCGPDDQKVATVKIIAVGADGKTKLTASAAPGGSFDLGTAPDDTPLTFCLSGLAADTTTVLARGQSITIPLGSVFGTLPLFIQRVSGFARPDGNLSHTHVRGQAAVFQERYLLLSGGDAQPGDDTAVTPSTAGSDFYDLLAQAPSVGGSLTRTGGAVVVRDTSVLSIDANGATWTDLTGSATAYDVALPSGVSASDFIGGRAIDTPTGATWIVGATRDDPPTSTILVVGADSTLSVRNLSAPRSGAAAAWIGDTFVVAGGSAAAPGVEITTETGSANALAYPPDATKGAALALLTTSQALLAGGVIDSATSPTRTISLECVAPTPDCAAAPSVGAPVDIAARSQAFVTTRTTMITADAPKPSTQTLFLVVGDDVSGQTRAFTVELNTSFGAATATEIPLKEPRKGATAIPTPNGFLAVMGGSLLNGDPATSVELYSPTDTKCD